MTTRLVTTIILVCMVTWVTCEQGYSDNNDDQWAYQWYLDEPFSLLCNSSKLNVQPGHNVTWETPGGNRLQAGYLDSHYEVKEKNDVRGMELLVKSVQEKSKGVYICRVYNGSDMQHRMVLGLNIHSPKYRDLFDKYRQNVIVAVIATLVFIVPLSTMCFVYHFQYRSPEDRSRRRLKKKGTHKYMYNAGEHPMKSTDQLADTGANSKENDAYDNPTFTKL